MMYHSLSDYNNFKDSDHYFVDYDTIFGAIISIPVNDESGAGLSVLINLH